MFCYSCVDPAAPPPPQDCVIEMTNVYVNCGFAPRELNEEYRWFAQGMGTQAFTPLRRARQRPAAHTSMKCAIWASLPKNRRWSMLALVLCGISPFFHAHMPCYTAACRMASHQLFPVFLIARCRCCGFHSCHWDCFAFGGGEGSPMWSTFAVSLMWSVS